ncbi:MAG: hypothetical protein EOP06_08455 [Proteobacteria bacterium]|nr:MAG: hypothetical protein EOP06_08455 [Pseudomonadota bacterium]
MSGLMANPRAVIGITGLDVIDKMETPWIKREYTRYIRQLSADTDFNRMRKYILQPEYYGKYRILWGVTKTSVLRDAFSEVLCNLEPGDRWMWSILPIDFAVLSRGDLVVDPRNLYHVELLPTSDGMKESKAVDHDLIKICRMGFRSFRRVIQKHPGLTSLEKWFLTILLKLEENYALARLIPFQMIRAHSPRAARLIKKLWFEILVRR